jgi:hypothetical protein
VRFPSTALLVVASIVACALLGSRMSDRSLARPHLLSLCAIADGARPASLRLASALDDDAPGDDDPGPETRLVACESGVALMPAPAKAGYFSPSIDPRIAGEIASTSLAPRAPPAAESTV